MKITEVNNQHDLSTLKDSWQALSQQCDHSIFSTWEYLSIWWRYFGKDATLRVLIAQENGEPLGIAPLMLLKHKSSHLGSLHKIQFLGHGSDYADFILPKKNTKCLKLFLDKLLQFSDWDILELEGINEESTTAKTLLEIQSYATPKFELNDWSLCYNICLSDSLKDFKNGLSRNMMKNLDKRMRRLTNNFKVEFKTQNDFKSVRVAMETFFNLHEKRWKSKGEPGAFSIKENRDFQISLAETFNAKGWLALYFLTVDDEPTSVAYTFDYNLRKYGCLTGFDPEFKQFGVGNLLKMHIIEECFRKGFREYDFGRGSESYKAEWATGVRKNLVLEMTKGGLRIPLLLWINNIKKYLPN